MVLKKVFKTIGQTIEDTQYVLNICLAVCIFCGCMVMTACLMGNDPFLYVSIAMFIEAGVLSVITGVIYTLYDLLDK